MSYKLLKVSLLAYLFLWFMNSPLQAQQKPVWEYPAFLDIFKLQLDHQFTPASPEDAYLSAYKTGLNNLINDTPRTSDAIVVMEASASVIETASLPEHYRQYYLNDILLFKAIMELKLGNEVKFMWMMNQLYRHTESLANANPDFLPAKKLHALMLIMIASVPDQYQWIFNLLGFTGDSEEGLQALEELSKSPSPLQYEGKALFYLITNYLQPELQKGRLEVLAEELSNKPDLYLLHFIAGLSHMKQHNSLQAREYFQHLTGKGMPIAHYLLAETFLHEGKAEEAKENYQLFLDHTKGTNLVKDAYFKLYILAYLNGEFAELEEFRKLANEKGSTWSEADKNADRLLNSEEMPHPVIFRIRFLTDGGFYDKALSLIKEYEDLGFTEKDRIELIYRKARLHHLSGNLNRAINGYKNSLAVNDNRYFAPNAALQLGFIYEIKAETNTARYYFEKVLEYKNYTYENSIRGKAKSALKSLNNN